jgi:hypothetical protein
VSYGHAAELQRTQPPLSRLEFLVRQLGYWADLNPALQPLHTEFVTIHRELREAGCDRIPAEIPPATVIPEEPGNAERQAEHTRDQQEAADAIAARERERETLLRRLTGEEF